MTTKTTRTARALLACKAITLLVIACGLGLNSWAQTVLTPYQPGVTSEGAVYCLPKTALRITIQVERTTYTPGDLCAYAERFLRLRDVSPTPSVSYRITTIRQEPLPVADSTKVYSVRYDPRTVAANVVLSPEGILQAINATPTPLPETPVFVPAPRPTPVNPRHYMSEEILAAGSTAKMAELTAQDIYDIREKRNLLVRGQSEETPHDGEQLRLMLNELNRQEHAMTSLFTGTTVSDTTEHTLTIVPTDDMSRQVLFRFSTRLGLLEVDDLAGVPYYINIEDLHTVTPPPPADPKKKVKAVQGIYVNIPGRMRATISDAEGQPLITAELPAPQFGNVELLSGALFNKRYTTRLWLHPLSGAVERLDASTPH